MIRWSAALAACGAAIAVALLHGCATQRRRNRRASIATCRSPAWCWTSTAARSIISGYRADNGLGAIVVDPELTPLATDRLEPWPARDKMDSDAVHPFQERIQKSGYKTRVTVENISAGYHTLAEATSPAGATRRRTARICSTLPWPAWGLLRPLRRIEIQSVLGR